MTFKKTYDNMYPMRRILMCTLVTHSVLTEHYMLGSLSFWTAHMPFAGTCNARNRAPTCCRAGSKHMSYNDGTIGIRRLFLCLK